MSFLPGGKVNYRARIERADLLASRYAFAKEILTFYAQVARFQQQLFARLPEDWGTRPVVPANGLRSELHLEVMMTHAKPFLALVRVSGPAPLAAQAESLETQDAGVFADILRSYWRTGLHESPSPGDVQESETARSDLLKEFLARAFLQPYAEFAVAAMPPHDLTMIVCRCPRCNSLPGVGVLRPEGDGGKRFLQCSFCSEEWAFRRIFCAFCGEDKEEKLPVYIAEELPHIRVEACDTCKHFLRTIDLTKDGHAVPLVDDLAAIPLTFWTDEHDYVRIQANLLGT